MAGTLVAKVEQDAVIGAVTCRRTAVHRVDVDSLQRRAAFKSSRNRDAGQGVRQVDLGQTGAILERTAGTPR